MGRFQPRDERLGSVLRDTLESRGPSAAAPLPGVAMGSRAFAAAVGARVGQPRAAAEPPRYGAIAVAAVICLVVTVGVAVWPAIAGARLGGGTAHAAAGPAPAAAPHPGQAAPAPAPLAAGGGPAIDAGGPTAPARRGLPAVPTAGAR